MARIRSIHPGLFSDENFMRLTVECPIAIPLLLGLWTEADDDGIFEWKPLTIKAKTLPAAAVDIDALLDILLSLNFVMRYEVSGRSYGAIRNFKTWQRPKQPKVKHPKTGIVMGYVGTSGEGLPHDLPTEGEMSPQRKEEGGRREEEDKLLAQHQEPAAALPDKFDLLLERLLDACGVVGFRAERHVGLVNLAPMLSLIAGGLDLDKDILPAIRSKPNVLAKTWAYFVPQIREFAQNRRSASVLAAAPVRTEDWGGRMDCWRVDKTWIHAWGPKPGEAGCRVPPNFCQQDAA
jgi:hypothetical protein